jgi:hypothetical protein
MARSAQLIKHPHGAACPARGVFCFCARCDVDEKELKEIEERAAQTRMSWPLASIRTDIPSLVAEVRRLQGLVKSFPNPASTVGVSWPEIEGAIKNNVLVSFGIPLKEMPGYIPEVKLEPVIGQSLLNRISPDVDAVAAAQIADRRHESKLVEELRARIATLEDAARWIPVGERLPDQDTFVEVWGVRPDDPASEGVWTAYHMRGAWHDDVRHGDLFVTHWRPLPLPPENSVL